MRRKRRNHLPGFKAKVALATIRGDKTLAELAEQVDGAGSTRDKIVRAFDRITLHENAIAERLLAYLRSRSDCRILGFENGSDERRVPTISFVVDGQDSGQIAKKMDAYNIAIRFGNFHARRLLEFLNLADNGGCVRVSMAHYNTISEVDALIGALEEVL